MRVCEDLLNEEERRILFSVIGETLYRVQVDQPLENKFGTNYVLEFKPGELSGGKSEGISISIDSKYSDFEGFLESYGSFEIADNLQGSVKAQQLRYSNFFARGQRLKDVAVLTDTFTSSNEAGVNWKYSTVAALVFSFESTHLVLYKTWYKLELLDYMFVEGLDCIRDLRIFGDWEVDTVEESFDSKREMFSISEVFTT